MKWFRRAVWKLQDRKAQILLPSALLAPIFILVIYLLFETAKVSMTKVRQQFALDNAAYSQMSSASTFLNAMAMVDGPLPYRVMAWFGQNLDQPGLTIPKSGGSDYDGPNPLAVYDLFYKAGAFPSIGPEYEEQTWNNPAPRPESNDWGIRYYPSPEENSNANLVVSRADWEKEQPAEVGSDQTVVIINKTLVDNYIFPADTALKIIQGYLETYVRVGAIFESQEYVYKEVSRNAQMFREGYFLNVSDCKKNECARQSAARLKPFLNLKAKPFEINKIRLYFSETTGSDHMQSYPIDLEMNSIMNDSLFQFAYLDSATRSRLRRLARGVVLKQNFKLPKNYFNINLEQKYKPYVRNTVVLSCPRSSNNCVWPNPIPKYTVTLKP